MKNWIKYCLIFSFVFSFCGCKTKNTIKPSDVTILHWMMPRPQKSVDSQKVFTKANNIISSQLKEIYVDFQAVNEYEYKEKLQLYLAAGEQIDIAWANDMILPYMLEINNGTFKKLDSLLDTDAKNINSNMNENIRKKISLASKIYYIPNLYNIQGLIPFLRIPRDFALYMNISDFSKAINGNETFTDTCYQPLEDYLNRIKSENLLSYDVDLYSLYDILPYKGYETILSTSKLFGYRKNDNRFNIINLMTSPEMNLFVSKMDRWYQNGFIRDDIDLVKNKKSTNMQSKEILQGVWGYYINDNLFILNDEEHNDNYIYIPIDKSYYTSKAVSSGITFIPKNSKNYIQAIKVLDLVYSKDNPELSLLLSYGIDGEHYTYNNSGTIIPTNNTNKYAMYPEVISNPTLAFYHQKSPIVSPDMFIIKDSPMDAFKLNTVNIRKDLYRCIITLSDHLNFFEGRNCINKYQNFLTELRASKVDKIQTEIQKQVNQYLTEEN